MAKQCVKMFEARGTYEELEEQINEFFHNPYLKIISISFFKTTYEYYALVAYENRGGI